MPDITLSEREQTELRRLMGAEPVPGHLLPEVSTLETVARLVPCDEIGVGLADTTGRLLESVDLPRIAHHSFDPQVCDGPLTLGIVHLRIDPRHRDLLARDGAADGVLIGFRNGRDHVVQIGLNRTNRPFAARDLAMVWMIAPALERLLRSRTTARLPGALTIQERRVLQHLARGMSNADIAAHLCVAPSTVRKHLEHSFRKLGVSNRMAAVIAFQQGGAPADTVGGGAEIFADPRMSETSG